MSGIWEALLIIPIIASVSHSIFAANMTFNSTEIHSITKVISKLLYIKECVFRVEYYNVYRM